MNKKWMRILALAWAAVMIAVIASTATLLLSDRSEAQARGRMVTEQEYDMIRRYDRLEDVRSTLMDEYYIELDEDALLLGAIRGMTSAVQDPYTFYYTPEEMARANENTRGQYYGIGVLIQSSEEGYIQILRVYPDTPAEAAGLRADDLIIAVDGEAISGEDGRTYNDAVDHIRGEAGTDVILTLMRDGETMDVRCSRGEVSISYATYQMLENSIGYVSLTQFSGDAAERFAEAIDFFRQNQARGMIIDLRNNPGGLLDQVVKIADSILPKGIIVYIRDRAGARVDYYSDEEMYGAPVVVLVNDMSASASEILASSVQALKRGKVVGVTTYGKGIVQTLYDYDDGAGIQLTTSSYFDASDRSIHGVGVIPDIEIALEADSIPEQPDPLSDNQLAAAIEEIERMNATEAQPLQPAA